MMETPIHYPPRIRLARLKTPLEALKFSRLPAGTHLFLKRDDLTETPLTGNKVRKLEFLLADAKRKNCDTVITCGGVQSNHARAVAIASARLGMRCVLFLRGQAGSVQEGNLFLNRVVGAEIHFIGVEDYTHRRDRIMEEHAGALGREGHQAYVICEGGSNTLGVWGYVRAMEELYTQSRKWQRPLTGIVAAVGSGGTHAGLLLGARLLNWDISIFGFNVCDDRRYFEQRIHDILSHTITEFGLSVEIPREAIQIIDGYVGQGYGQTSESVHRLIAAVASETGIILDPVYTGKAFYGMIQEIERGTFGQRPILSFIHTGGVFGFMCREYSVYYGD